MIFHCKLQILEVQPFFGEPCLESSIYNRLIYNSCLRSLPFSKWWFTAAGDIPSGCNHCLLPSNFKRHTKRKEVAVQAWELACPGHDEKIWQRLAPSKNLKSKWQTYPDQQWRDLCCWCSEKVTLSEEMLYSKTVMEGLYKWCLKHLTMSPIRASIAACQVQTTSLNANLWTCGSIATDVAHGLEKAL